MRLIHTQENKSKSLEFEEKIGNNTVMAIQVNKRMIVLSGLVLVLGLWIAGSIIVGMEYFNLKKKVDSNDAKAVVTRLQKHMKTPTEEPLVATITDAIKLKEQEPFYKNAQNGDKVVIWKDKALIYRMEEDKIIDFGVVIRSQQSQAEQVDSVAPRESTPQEQPRQVPEQTPASEQ